MVFSEIESNPKFVENNNFPIVIKADNLASGKGVYISKNLEEANIAIDEIFDGKFGKCLLIEEFLIGEEMSFLLFMMEKYLKLLEQLKTIKEFKKEKVKIPGAWELTLHQD